MSFWVALDWRFRVMMHWAWYTMHRMALGRHRCTRRSAFKICMAIEELKISRSSLLPVRSIFNVRTLGNIGLKIFFPNCFHSVSNSSMFEVLWRHCPQMVQIGWYIQSLFSFLETHSFHKRICIRYNETSPTRILNLITTQKHSSTNDPAPTNLPPFPALCCLPLLWERCSNDSLPACN